MSNNGFVYRIAGGAPIYVSNWAAVGGAQPTTALGDAEFDALPQTPRDGTVLDASGGRVFVVAGGAALYLSTWDAIGGPKPGVGVDEAAIDNAGGGVPWNHLRSYPADGTLLAASGGGVFVVAGGAPLYLSSWSAIGGERPYVAVDQWDVDNTANPLAHLRSYPADGTFLNTSAGHVYRTAGGAPFAVSTWSIFGGVQPYVTVDEWDLDNMSNPIAHLIRAPHDGTVVQGLPSDSFWAFEGGYRHHAVAISGAVTVDDFGLAAFPQEPTGSPSIGSLVSVAGKPATTSPTVGVLAFRARTVCLVPNLKHLTISQATRALHKAHCRLGKVRRRGSPRRHSTPRVTTQSAHARTRHRSGYTVNVRVS